MRFLFNSICGGFGRSVGRVLGFLFVFFLLFLILNSLDIDFSNILKLRFPFIFPVRSVIIQ